MPSIEGALPPAHQPFRISVVGLGYVGLPVAVAFAEAGYPVIGYDIDDTRVCELRDGRDRTDEITSARLKAIPIGYTSDPRTLKDANFHIVTVPTPISLARRPDLTALISASREVGRVLKPGDIVVFESTVYPGTTEEVCVPILEAESGLAFNQDFYVGYSPERINPGDPVHRFETIKKVVSASSEAALTVLANVYGGVVTAGLHLAPSIKVAEAAKVIENTQRDLNIALMNELAMIFDRLGIASRDVLAAAGSKWNFLPFEPGLVGGHCIGVDPYYLAAKAEDVGYQPEVILAGRRTNEAVAPFIAQRIVRFLFKSGLGTDARVGVFGATFKEDVPDPRNSKVRDIVEELQSAGLAPIVHDPLADPDDLTRQSGLSLTPIAGMTDLDVGVYAVPHGYYSTVAFGSLTDRIKPDGLVVDIKSRLDRATLPKGLHYWSL